MASWIVHLRIAEAVLGGMPFLDASAFAVGSLAPDSGIPDEKWEKFTPPPEISHFQSGSSVNRQVADLAFFRRYLHPLEAYQKDVPRFSFLLGYFFHLVTDNLWAVEVGRPTHQKFLTQFEADKNFIWEVKRDWYGLDFEYTRSHPQSIFWRVFLPAQFSGDYLDFMPLHAIQQRMEYIKSFYQRTDDEVEQWYLQHPGLYLTQAEMDAFVCEAAGTLERAYRWLAAQPAHLAEHQTVLDSIAP